MLALGLVLGACGVAATPPAPPGGPGIDLPVVGTLGIAPPEPDAIVLYVTADGRILLDGDESLSWGDLQRELASRTADPEWRKADGTSRHVLLLNIDTSVPWIVVQWILTAAAGPDVNVTRIFFGVRGRASEARGAIGCGVPADHGIRCSQEFIEEPPAFSVAVLARPHAPRSDPEALFPRMDAILRGAGHPPQLVLVLRTPWPYGSRVPAGFVIQILDVAIRAGVTDVLFGGSGAPLPPEGSDIEWMTRVVGEVKAENAVPYIKAGEELVGAFPEDSPLPPTRGRLPYLYGVNLDHEPDPEPFPEPSGEPQPVPFSNHAWVIWEERSDGSR